MDFRSYARTASCTLITLCFWAGVNGCAETIGVTYSYSQSVSGDPANPPLIGNGTGSLLPFGTMAWSDRAFPDLATGAYTGSFSIAFASGGSLFGDFHGDTDFTSPPTATAFTEILDVNGGTGPFAGYSGTLSGNGLLNLLTFQESVSGSGTLNAAPEPGSMALLPVGLLCWLIWRSPFSFRELPAVFRSRRR